MYLVLLVLFVFCLSSTSYSSWKWRTAPPACAARELMLLWHRLVLELFQTPVGFVISTLMGTSNPGVTNLFEPKSCLMGTRLYKGPHFAPLNGKGYCSLWLYIITNYSNLNQDTFVTIIRQTDKQSSVSVCLCHLFDIDDILMTFLYTWQCSYKEYH